MRTLKSYTRVAAALVTMSLTIGLLGCKRLASASGSIFLSSNLPLRSYVHSAVGGNGHKSTSVSFPLLQIYNVAGKLIYVGHDARANASLLQQIPGNLGALPPLPDTTALPDVIRQFPEFALKSEDILHSQKPTVISVFLETCHACTVQEQALDSSQQQLLDRGVNLLVIHVARPA